jgi:hypothetical protein
MSHYHPPPDEMALYFRGLLDETVAASLETHCASCDDCAELLRAEARVEVALYELQESLADTTRRPAAKAARRIPRLAASVALLAAAGVLIHASTVRKPTAGLMRSDTTLDERTPSMQARHAVFNTMLTLAAAAMPVACSAPATETSAGAIPSALDPLPAMWRAGGRVPGAPQEQYAMGVDPSAEAEGHLGLAIFANPNARRADDFASLGAHEDATPYRGKRVRLTGLLKAEGVTGWSGLWMRVDGEAGPLALDNMHSRPVCGTSGWTAYNVVLDVDPRATEIVYGSVLSGGGRLWADAPKLELVDASIPVTAPPMRVSFSAAHVEGFEPKWFISGRTPELYLASADPTVHRSGAASLSIGSKAPPQGAAWGDGSNDADIFGTAMQFVPVEAHRGHKVRFSADVRTDNVRGWAGLWMRVDGPEGGAKPLSIDNMEGRALTGTADWARYSIVLEVPSIATAIGLGVVLVGEGHVWVDNVVLEDADPAATLTNNPSP